MSKIRKADALVVGAGPVGLLTALKLVRNGIDVSIIDSQQRTGAHSYALALHSSSLDILDQVDLSSQILDTAYRINSVALYEGTDRRNTIDLTSRGAFLAVIGQDVLETALEQALRQHGNKVHWNHEASGFRPTDAGMHITIDEIVEDSVGYSVEHVERLVGKSSEIEVPFVIGADGYKSRVRRAAEIQFPEVGTAQHYGVFEFRTDFEPEAEMRLLFGRNTTDVLWPLPGRYCRWSFELPDYRAEEINRSKSRIGVQIGPARFPVLSEDNLHRLLTERAPWFHGSVEDIRWRIVVRFERRLADSFGRGAAWLAGDSGHITGPAGIQSMNVGLREGSDLAERISGILKGRRTLVDLETYGRERIAEWKQLLGIDGSDFGNVSDEWLRLNAARILPCIPASGEHLTRLLSDLGLTVTVT